MADEPFSQSPFVFEEQDDSSSARRGSTQGRGGLLPSRNRERDHVALVVAACSRISAVSLGPCGGTGRVQYETVGDREADEDICSILPFVGRSGVNERLLARGAVRSSGRLALRLGLCRCG